MPQLSNKTKFSIAAGVGVVLLAGGLMFPVAMPEIVLPAEEITHISGFPITNTLLATWLTMLLLIGVSFAATRNLRLVPTGLQNLMEAMIEATLGIAEGVAGKEKARQFFSLVMTIFLFVLISNWMGLLPGFSTIGVIKEPEPGHHASSFERIDLAGIKVGYTPIGKKVEAQELRSEGDHGSVQASEGENAGGLAGVFVPLLRSANSGVNTTLALALVAMVFVEYFGIKSFGLATYGSKFLNVGKIFRGQVASGLLDLYVGILETISEMARIVSFTFRLFGNVFAGEVLLAVITFLVPWIAALPFMGLELFVGFIQAFVFAMLTLVFLTVATIHPHGEGAHKNGGHH